MSRYSRIIVGLIAGALLAGLGVVLGTRTGSEPLAADVGAVTTTTLAGDGQSVPVEPAWIDEDGVRFESTVLVVDELAIDGSSAILDYRAISLAPADGFFFGGSPLPAALPETWVLTTTTGRTIEALGDAPRQSDFVDSEAAVGISDSIRFETEDGSDIGDAASVQVTSWRIAVPSQAVVEMAGVKGASATLYDSTVIQLQTVIEQSTGAIVDFDLDRPSDPWRVAIDQGFGVSTEFVGDGPGWGRASSTIGGIGLSGGITGFQLVWNEPTAPDVVRVRASLLSWEPLDSEVTVWSVT